MRWIWLFLALACVVPASAITVQQPADQAVLVALFTVSASTSTCAGVPAVSMGYSLDDQNGND